ncbi:uncharacterized protein [Miscanthus floridulus]|uniref:uncharacterized protein isoform X2 n=1 Tax=Miscanthus floridulus TaxID=154761 RepID=UPI0034585E72
MELRRLEHERRPPQVGALRVDPCEKQDVPERSAGPLEVLAVKEEKSGGELRLAVVDGVVNIDSDSDPDPESDSKSDKEVLVLGNKRSSVRKGSSQEKLTGKKRTADMLQEDSRAEAGEGAEEIVDGQESGNKKLSSSDFNISSQPNKICEAVALLNEPQREKVKELGFGSLLDFRMDKRGPYNLIFWLMDHLDPDDQDPDTMVLYSGGNRKLLITQHTINCVLGLQKGKLDPPLMPTNTRNLNGLKLLREKLGVPAGKRVKVGDLLKKIQSGGTDRFTMQCFMMIVFCKLMACSSRKYITESAWDMVNKNFDKFGHMNWCKFIVDQLKYSANMWKEQSGKLKDKIVYGCSAFLVMYYLDNLDCDQKMRCVEVPRAKFFGSEMIQKLVKADKQEEDGLPIFGNLNLRNQRIPAMMRGRN